MAEQLLTIAIQILFPLALFKFTVWSMLIRPVLRWRRRLRLARAVTAAPRARQRRPQRPRRQPPPPDPLETAYINGGPYAETPLSDELYQAIAVLLVLYGALGVDPGDLTAAINRVNTDHYLRAVTRIKAVAERLAEAGVENNDGTTDLAATGYLLELADKLRGLNRMQTLQ